MNNNLQNNESIYSKKPWLSSYPEDFIHEVDIPTITIYQLLEHTADKQPNDIAVIDGERTTTFLQFKNACEFIAAGLVRQGFQKGDRIALMMPNSLEYTLSFFAVQRMGGVVVQVNPNFQPSELNYLLKNAEATGLIAFREQKEKLEKAELTQQLVFISADDNLQEELNIHSWIAREEMMNGTERIQSKDLAILTYTGGTTGFPKGVKISHFNMIANLVQSYESSKRVLREKGNCQLGISPLYHGMGLFSFLQSIKVGATFVIVQKFDLNHLLQLIRKYKPTMFTGSPTMYIALLNHPERTKADLNSFKLCHCGSAPLPIEVIRRFKEESGVSIMEGYGLSEATCGAIRNPYNGVKKVGSIGLPMPNTDVKIVDIATGKMEMPLGKRGEIIIKGPQVMDGYWKNKEETDNVIRDGWLYTGDIGTMDNEGYFYIVGRKKEMIISGGFNVYPVEIEEVLYKHPSVQEACVYGVPDSYRGEAIKAVIALKKGTTLTIEEIQTWCKTYLTRYKVPRLFEFRESLPKTPVGKILRRELIAEDQSRVDIQ